MISRRDREADRNRTLESGDGSATGYNFFWIPLYLICLKRHLLLVLFLEKADSGVARVVVDVVHKALAAAQSRHTESHKPD